jgi:hypothetical protein
MNINAIIDEAVKKLRNPEDPKSWDEFFEWLILQGVDVSDPEEVTKGILRNKAKFYASVLGPAIDTGLKKLKPLDSFDETGYRDLITANPILARECFADYDAHTEESDDWISQCKTPSPMSFSDIQANAHSRDPDQIFDETVYNFICSIVFGAIDKKIKGLKVYATDNTLENWIRSSVLHELHVYLARRGILLT